MKMVGIHKNKVCLHELQMRTVETLLSITNVAVQTRWHPVEKTSRRVARQNFRGKSHSHRMVVCHTLLDIVFTPIQPCGGDLPQLILIPHWLSIKSSPLLIKSVMKNWYSLYLPQFIYGGIDGLVTTFAVVAGATGGWLSSKTVIIMGIANVLADGVSMSIWAYLSTREDAKQQICATCVAVSTFAAFIFFWCLPLLPYIFSFWNFIFSSIITGVAFVVIGYLKGIMNRTSLLKAMSQTVLLWGIAAGIAYSTWVFLGSL